MKYLKQMSLIMLFSFLGEVCRYLIPLTIPASIYGMLLLFGALLLKIVRVESIRESGMFLTSLLPVLFVPPLVQLVEYWPLLKPVLVALFVISIVTTIFIFACSGAVTQWLIGKGEKKDG